ncbi:MAG: tetratricopeptide repeat protein [Symploca sp. SIO1C4]|uniref:Tetratricopeptide repeat protein n=1 Tax=Symploca sp. SIO1C4 TaxID=2607765 RepID=A0A6B3NDA3_9CYAN|nr:tetratricopeptide repeat protein [Symploca sp. SIO1C4]
MSINKKTGRRHSSRSEGNNALELFTGRYEFTRLFAKYLNSDPPHEQILFFYGDGGNGKSLLLRFLRTRCCKRFPKDIWQQLETKSDAKVIEYIDKLADSRDYVPIISVIHDFGQQPRGDDQPQDPFYGLLMLRRNLANAAKALGYRLHFPLYDFACVWYLHQQGKLTRERIRDIFPQEELELLNELVEILSGIPGVGLAKAVLGIFSKCLSQGFTVLQRKWRVNEDDVRTIQAMEPDSELIDELPRLFAADLNAAMRQPEAPPRIVLFFDTHEAFWGQERHLTGQLRFQRDEWLRYLVGEVELSAGIMVVVAGREQPRWDEASRFNIPARFIDTQLISHFSATDADTYLRRAGIEDAELCEGIITYASVAPGQVHPFYLGLCADVVWQAQQRGQNLTAADFRTAVDADHKPKELIERLLRYVGRDIEYAVHALSACRAFDYELYRQLGTVLEFDVSKPDFEILTEFSFVWNDQRQGGNWYRIHDLLRRLDDEINNPKTRQAHAMLEKYYRGRRDIAEAIYHTNRLDWEQGVEEWIEVFEQGLKLSRYEQCRILLEIRNELSIKSDFHLGSVSQFEGDYFVQLARHSEAKQEYLEAISTYNHSLALAPDDNEILNNKGNALQSLGDVYTKLAQHPQALDAYTQALAAYNSSLDLEPEYIYALNNKGTVLQRLGDLQTRLAQYPQALVSYSEAIASYNHSLVISPNYNEVLNNKGIALQKLGDLQTKLAQNSQALQSYEQAIIAYNSALKIDPDYTYALNNQGLVLQRLGDLQAKLAQHLQALKSYEQAINTYNNALTLAPDYIYALNNKGLALQRLGDLQTKVVQPRQALISYSQAITTHDSALSLAPNDICALNNKAIALQRLGYLHIKLEQYPQALDSYSQAIATYDHALTLAPNYISALNNKGIALQKLGYLQTQLEKYPLALVSYREAIATYNRALAIAPDDVYALNNKGAVLQRLGYLQTKLAQYQQALQSYLDAIASYDSSLSLAPDDICALNNKASVLSCLGDLYDELYQGQEAMEYWQAALSMFSRCLDIAPSDEYIRNLRDQLQVFVNNLKVRKFLID